jgi:hypothetical protein
MSVLGDPHGFEATLLSCDRKIWGRHRVISNEHHYAKVHRFSFRYDELSRVYVYLRVLQYLTTVFFSSRMVGGRWFPTHLWRFFWICCRMPKYGQELKVIGTARETGITVFMLKQEIFHVEGLGSS